MSSNKSIPDIITDEILLDDGQMMRKIRLYDERIKNFDSTIAYLKGDYFYIYRGPLRNKEGTVDEPGIYYDELTNQYVLFEPSTEDEIKKYQFDGKITSSTAIDIINKINSKEVEVFVIPDGAKMFCPTITEADDILKRIMKRAIIDKGIDLDRFKYRFMDKNALFNFKQVVKGDNRLSMLLFDRGIEAFNLKYTIIVEEAQGDTIGMKLESPIVVSSEDTYDILSAKRT